MLALLADRWWMVLLRGVAAVLFGILAIAWPGITVLALVLLYGAYALIDGVSELALAIGGRDLPGSRRGLLVLLGLLGVAAAVVAVVWPGITALVLVYVIAAWAVITGIFEIAAAIQLRKEIEGEWAMALSGALSVVLGVVLFARPGTGALALVTVIGIFAIAWGAVLVVLSFRLRGMREPVPSSA